ncbi:unnamed protein product [Caenorhabditis nigoni]
MANNEKEQTEAGENPKANPPLDKDETLEKLKLVVAETEEIKHSQKRKFDEMAEKLQSIEESVSKISKTDNDGKSFLSNNHSNKEQESRKIFSLKDVFENVYSLKEDEYVCSEDEEHFNVKWNIEVGHIDNHLGFYVHCKPIAPIGNKYTIEAKLEFKMLGNDDNTAIKTVKFCFDKDEVVCGYEHFLKWEEMEYDFLINEKKLTAEVKVEILKMSGFGKKKIRRFDESQKDVSDVVLVVNGTKFYISKMYLAAQSSFFKTLFLGNFSESNKSEIPLSGIDSEDFQRFLEVLYSENAVDDSTVEGILLVADLYDAPTVVGRCEMFLLHDSDKEFKKKLQISTKYRLQSLKKECLSKIDTLDDVQRLLPCDLSDLDPSAALIILQKCVSSH